VLPVSKRKRKARPAAKPKRRPARRTPQQRREEEPDLLDLVVDALVDDEPLPLLALASSLLAAADPRYRSALDDPDPDDPTVDDLISSLLSSPVLESSALLTAVAVLSGDEDLRKRAAREVADRAHSLPGWLVELHRAEPADEVLEIVDPHGDGTQVLLDVTLLGGHAITAVVVIDVNVGDAVVDALIMPVGMDDAVEEMLTTWDDPDVTATPLAPADARARLAAGIVFGDFLDPPFESETWPSARPLVEWILRMLPDGGRRYERHRWTETETADLEQRFRASSAAEGLVDPDAALAAILRFGTGTGCADPRRWSPARVEMLLLDWMPTAEAGADAAARIPDVLRAFVRWTDGERQLRPDLTEWTLALLDELEPEYRAAFQ
jgi:hypothetical protein